MDDKGTYNVQPQLTPESINNDIMIRIRLNSENHRLNAFNRGNIISLQPISSGINKLPKPPIKIGIIIKNIINKPWNVIIEL